MIRTKKGEGMIDYLFFIAFEILIAGMLVLAVYTKINAVAQSSSYEQQFYSKDLALIADSMQAANGEMAIDYEIGDRFNLDILASDSRIAVSESGKDKSSGFFYEFGGSRWVDVKESSSQLEEGDQKKFNIRLKDNQLMLSNNMVGDVDLE